MEKLDELYNRINSIEVGREWHRIKASLQGYCDLHIFGDQPIHEEICVLINKFINEIEDGGLDLFTPDFKCGPEKKAK